MRRLRDALSKFLQATADARVEDLVADLQDDATEDLTIDPAGEVDLLPGLTFDLRPDFLDNRRVELDGAGDGHVEPLVLLLPELLEAATDTEDLGHPPLIDQQLEEVE